MKNQKNNGQEEYEIFLKTLNIMLADNDIDILL